MHSMMWEPQDVSKVWLNVISNIHACAQFPSNLESEQHLNCILIRRLMRQLLRSGGLIYSCLV